MQIVHSGEVLPTRLTKSVFLAGPTPRNNSVPSWRSAALKFLREVDFDGHVFVPEARDGSFTDDTQWKWDAMNCSDVVLFWIPRDMLKMPALATNTDFGIWCAQDPARAFLGAPTFARHTSYQFKLAKQNGIPIFRGLEEMVQAVVAYLGAGAERESGAVNVPLHIWKTDSFQNWYKAQTEAGVELRGVRVKWVFRNGSKRLLHWALMVDSYLPGEQLYKSDEMVISSPDVHLTVAR